MSRLRTFLKWTLFAVVLAYVCRHGYRLWRQSEEHTSLTPQSAGWLLASAVFYVASWLPSIWFWRQLMRALGDSPAFADAARAYYVGALGKYVPGKAMVLVLRGGLMKDRGTTAQTAAITAAYETLTMMGTGLLVGLLFSPLPDWPFVRDRPLLLPIAIIAVAAGLPLIGKVLSWVVAKMTSRDLIETSTASSTIGSADASISVPSSRARPPATPVRLSIPTMLVGAGCGAFLMSWFLQGVSLAMTLCAAGEAFDVHQVPVWSGAMGLSTSVGFAVLFAPAGLGVREGILLGILTEAHVDAGTAVTVTVLSRLVAFISDLLVAAVFYGVRRNPAVAPRGPADG